MRTVEIKCMVCEKDICVEIPDTSIYMSMIFEGIAKNHDWQTTCQDHKLHLCCSDCIPKVYRDLDQGHLGHLKKSSMKRMIEDVEI